MTKEEFESEFPGFQRCSKKVLDDKIKSADNMNSKNKESDKWQNSRWSDENRRIQSDKFKILRKDFESDENFINKRIITNKQLMKEYWDKYKNDKEFHDKQQKMKSDRMKSMWNDSEFRERYSKEIHKKGSSARSLAMIERWKDEEYRKYMRSILLRCWKDPEYIENQKKYESKRINSNKKYKRYEFITSSGDKLTLKSSFEVSCAEILESENVNYEYESLRVCYDVNGENHTYIPDFYIPQYNLIIEVKPAYLVDDIYNQAKMIACKLNNYNFIFVTENELKNNSLSEILTQFESSTTIESVAN